MELVKEKTAPQQAGGVDAQTIVKFIAEELAKIITEIQSMVAFNSARIGQQGEVFTKHKTMTSVEMGQHNLGVLLQRQQELQQIMARLNTSLNVDQVGEKQTPQIAVTA